MAALVNYMDARQELLKARKAKGFKPPASSSSSKGGKGKGKRRKGKGKGKFRKGGKSNEKGKSKSKGYGKYPHASAHLADDDGWGWSAWGYTAADVQLPTRPPTPTTSLSFLDHLPQTSDLLNYKTELEITIKSETALLAVLPGYGILDSGATKSLIGSHWANPYRPSSSSRIGTSRSRRTGLSSRTLASIRSKAIISSPGPSFSTSSRGRAVHRF